MTIPTAASLSSSEPSNAIERTNADLKYVALSSDPDESHMLGLSLLHGAGRVLEIGAATGYVTEAMRSQGMTVVAVEVDEAAAAIARARGVDIRVGNVRDVVGKDERFDAILLMDVIEHVTDPDALLEDCLQHLAPGGRVVVSVPNVANWRVRWALMRGRFDYTRTGIMDATHVRFYTAASLERLLNQHGLRVTERRYSLGLYAYARLESDDVKWQRRRVLRWGRSMWPRLFGFQFVWSATRKEQP